MALDPTKLTSITRASSGDFISGLLTGDLSGFSQQQKSQAGKISMLAGNASDILNSLVSIKQLSTDKKRVNAQAFYTSEILKFNTGLELEALSRGTRRLRSTQTAQSASTGFSVTSGSFLALANETITTAERAVIDRRIGLQNQLNTLEYERRLALESISDAKRKAIIDVGVGVAKTVASFKGSA